MNDPTTRWQEYRMVILTLLAALAMVLTRQ